MPRKPEEYTNLHFPFGGVSEHDAYSRQWDGTCVDARNVRGYDPATGRLRGGQRAGHSKYVATNFGAAIQHIQQIAVSTAYSGSGASARSVTAIAVAGGTVKTFTSSSVSTATSGSGALSSTFPWIDSAVNLGVVYFVDGANAKKYTASTNTVATWSASAGSLPSNGSDLPRLICTWRGRIVLSGLVGDGQNWFMSKVGDPTDWDYGPATTTQIQAVAGNNTDAGKCPDIINSLIPYRDDLLIFGGDHTIYQMTGDPAAGGSIDLVSDITGMAFGKAWCKDPRGAIFFFGSRGGLYVYAPGQGVEKLSSKKIDERLSQIDLSTTVVKLAWDDRQQYVMIYCTPVDGSATTHYVYDLRNNAFWLDEFADADHSPLSVMAFDGDDPGDRCLMLGCLDGYVRKVDTAAKSDDGEAIDSYVWLGPFQGSSGQIKLRETRIALGGDSGPVSVDIHRGDSPESAFQSKAFNSFGVVAGNEIARSVGANGQALYLKLSNSCVGQSWAYESGQIRMEVSGSASGRRVFR